MFTITEEDWKIYRVKIVEWQENYMGRLVQEYMQILSKEDGASTRFWELEERINKDKLHPGVIVVRKRSNAIITITQLVQDKVIDFDALKDFSSELQSTIMTILNVK